MEQAGTLVVAQGGGQKGHSTISQATQQVLKTELVHLNQKSIWTCTHVLI